MKWEDLLCGSIPKFKNIDNLPQCDDSEKEDLKSQYHRVEKMILYPHSLEGNVCHKVFILLFALFLNCKKEFFVWTDLKDHTTFTDFLIKITDGEEKCIIVEVKNVLVACNLNIQCNEVAQVLRQAQIIIQDMKLINVTFVLTNSTDWYFEMAKKEDKIEVAWATHFNISADTEALVKVYELFKKI